MQVGRIKPDSLGAKYPRKADKDDCSFVDDDDHSVPAYADDPHIVIEAAATSERLLTPCVAYRKQWYLPATATN